MKYRLPTLFALGIMSAFTVSCSAAPNSDVPAKRASEVPQIVKTSIKQSSAMPAHVVELFTSQGCSSCPPANKFVGEIADKDGVLVLSYGVTYWDYLGWKDTFGSPAFTKRQREYRPILGTSNIYTPQIVLNGAKHSPRYSETDVLSAKMSEDAASSHISVQDGKIIIEGDAPQGSTLALISYMPGEQKIDVKRGENGGRSLKLTNVVTDVVKMPWDGQKITTQIDVKAGTAYAALFHGAKTGNIISAAAYAP